MTWKDAVEADVVRVFQNEDEMAVSVTYTTTLGVSSSITVFLEEQAGFDFVHSVNDDYDEERQSFMINLADVATPKKGDKITYLSKDYKLDSSSGNDEQTQTWDCIYKVRIKAHGK